MAYNRQTLKPTRCTMHKPADQCIDKCHGLQHRAAKVMVVAHVHHEMFICQSNGINYRKDILFHCFFHPLAASLAYEHARVSTRHKACKNIALQDEGPQNWRLSSGPRLRRFGARCKPRGADPRGSEMLGSLVSKQSFRQSTFDARHRLIIIMLLKRRLMWN